ncbi:MAG: ArsR/SmtB family transcription factor [Acidimicrobiales bacterium]
MVETGSNRGDSDLAALGALIGDARRCRILLALGDGRALPASRLAAEAGVTPATASNHLSRLVAGGLLQAERHGRHRFFRLSGPQVGRLIESMAEVAPAQPVRSLRQSSQAHAVREARTCYDHLAGRLGVAVMAAMLERRYLVGGDGRFSPERARADRLNAYGRDVDYRLTSEGTGFFNAHGIALASGRPIRYRVDWSEQRHHLSGALGRNVLSRLSELRWLHRSPRSRAVELTPAGRVGLADWFGLTWPLPAPSPP